MFTSVCVYVRVYARVCLSVCLSWYIHLRIELVYAPVSIRLSTTLPVFVYVCVCLCVCVCGSVCFLCFCTFVLSAHPLLLWFCWSEIGLAANKERLSLSGLQQLLRLLLHLVLLHPRLLLQACERARIGSIFRLRFLAWWDAWGSVAMIHSGSCCGHRAMGARAC